MTDPERNNWGFQSQTTMRIILAYSVFSSANTVNRLQRKRVAVARAIERHCRDCGSARDCCGRALTCKSNQVQARFTILDRASIERYRSNDQTTYPNNQCDLLDVRFWKTNTPLGLVLEPLKGKSPTCSQPRLCMQRVRLSGL